MGHRISRDDMFAEIATSLSKRADCQRGQAGCLITIDNRIVSTGYNSPPKGEASCSSLVCNTDEPCVRTIHAEANAIYFAARNGIEIAGGTLWTTLSPCMKCCEAILQAGIREVVYMTDFREDKGWNMLERDGIKIRQYVKRV